MLWKCYLGYVCLLLIFGIVVLNMGIFVILYNYVGFCLMSLLFLFLVMLIGLIFSVYIFGIVFFFWVGLLVDCYGCVLLVVVGIVILCVGLFLICILLLVLVIMGIVLLIIGFFIMYLVVSSWVGCMVSSGCGYVVLFYLLFYYLGGSVFGLVGGWFWEYLGWNVVVVFMLL